MWANENWTRRWDGHDNEVLMAQMYSVEDDRAHLRHLAPALRDDRYIRIDGKPLLLVYRVSLLPDPARTAEVWREEAHAAGVGELYLAAVAAMETPIDPSAIGFDASVEFSPDWRALHRPLFRVTV